MAAEHDSRTGAWYLRVWAQLGTDRSHRVSHAIRLERDEPPEELLERARGAVYCAAAGGGHGGPRAGGSGAHLGPHTLTRT